MSEVLASAAAKLATTEHPIAVPRHKYMLEGLKTEAERLQNALENGEDIVGKSAIWLPVWLPGWIKALIRWLAWPFLKAKIVRRMPSESVTRAKISELKDTLARLNSEMLRGILTPLTLADEAECNAYYYKTLRHLESVLPQEETPEGQKARAEAVGFTTTHYHNAKRLECVLKRKDKDGKLVRSLTPKEAHALDPRLVAEIWLEHQATFELTEDELGK